MSGVKVHRVRYRLAAQLRVGAKISTSTALNTAEDRLKALEPSFLEAIGVEVARLETGLEALGRGEVPAIGLMYETANGIVGLAGAAPRLRALGTAALSLCDLLDGLGGAVPKDLRPIAVHVDALRVLRADLPERDQLVVLGGLTKLRDHYSAKAAPAGS